MKSENKTLYIIFNSNSKAETIVNESDVDNVFESIYSTIISNIQKSLGQGSGWIIDSFIFPNISIIPQLVAVIPNYQNN